jgi:hypothetical protein
MENKLAFVVCCDENYFDKALTTLLSFKRFKKDCGYYIFGCNFKEEIKNIIMDKGIKYVNCCLYDEFTTPIKLNNNVSWPSECFWWYYAPMYLREQGFKFSCVLDGDVLCLNDIDIQFLNNLTTFGGINNGFVYSMLNGTKTLLDENNKKFKLIQAENGMNYNDLKKYTTNTGVLWINNDFYIDNDLYNIFQTFYQKNNINFSIYSDQHLFSYFVHRFDFLYLEDKLNYIINRPFIEASIVHFTSHKPWIFYPYSNSKSIYYKKWTEFRASTSL